MKAMVLLTLPPALMACTPQQQAGDSREATPTPATPPVATAPAAPAAAPEATVELPGEYRIAGVDGGEIDQPYAITASITPDRIHVTADCLNFAWTYTAQGDRIATKRAPVEGCGRGLTASEEAVVAALDAASTVARTPGNAIELRGGARTLTMFSQ